MQPSIRPLFDRWWVPVARGLLAIVFGIFAALIPQPTLRVLLMLFGAFALLDGMASLGSAVGSSAWGWQLFGGLLSIVTGAVTVLRPSSTAFALVVLIACWAIARGVLDIAMALSLPDALARRCQWLLALSGIASVLFGFFVALWPLLGVLSIAGVIAGFAILLGTTLIAAGVRQRSLHRHSLHTPRSPDDMGLHPVGRG
jgi:uncharacterized membrane protein HdeD (DUF308 family)